MPFVHTFLKLNREIILFVYGLVFFVLGLVVALQSRHSSRLDLARSLSWLAAFGITHGLHEWGDLFIPIQKSYLSEPVIRLLNVVQLVLLAVSFTFLLEFGVALLRLLGRSRRWHGVPAALFLVWVLVAFFMLLPFSSSPTAWQSSANALARYCIGFPGGLLAAYGLRQQALHRIAPLNVPGIINTLRIAVVSLGLYAIFSGLIPPPVSFFPGNVLNSMTFSQVVGVPPIVFRSMIGFVLTVAIIRALEVFDIEIARVIEAMEQQQILASERDRIARELHDGAIQTVYTAGLLVESARNLTEPGSLIANRLDKAVAVLNGAIGDLRRNLSELRAVPSDVALPEALRRLAQDPSFHSFVDVSLDLDVPDSESLPPIRVNHILAIVHEALSNVVRHAHARQVKVCACHADGRLIVTVQDDGIGLPRQVKAGFGLRDMRDRARLLGGQLDVANVKGKGASVTLDVPWKDER